MNNRIVTYPLNILRFIFRTFYLKPIAIWKFLINRKEYCCHESYFPDKQQKSFNQIFSDQLAQVLKYGYPNEFYFPYGFDVKTVKEMNQYLHYSPFRQRRDSRNISTHSPTAILRDKLLFGMFTSFYGIESAGNLAISTREGLFNLSTKTYQSLKDFLNNLNYTNLFLKPIDGECGKGIYHLMLQDDKILASGREINISHLENILSESSYLIQTTIVQHEKMSHLHPQSINTIRLVTIRNAKTQKPEIFPSILRIGTGEAIVDNTSQGGLAVGIDIDTGQLKEFGFYKPQFGTKVSEHPDSGIKFSDFTIPFFEECKRQALFLHSRLLQIHSIGWDIAIGKNGPIFVEGNDNWEINGPQICNGGLKEVFLKVCGE